MPVKGSKCCETPCYNTFRRSGFKLHIQNLSITEGHCAIKNVIFIEFEPMRQKLWPFMSSLP